MTEEPCHCKTDWCPDRPVVDDRTEWDRELDDLLLDIGGVMRGRHRKYGPGNIARHGLAGLRVRLDDKLARLEAGNDDYPDESVRDTALDVVGYGLIYLMWLDGTWPGSKETR